MSRSVNKGGRRPGFTVDHRGAKNPRWKGGRRICSSGYVLMHAPEWEGRLGIYAYEHVVMATAALGRPIPEGAQVHHVNGDKADNRPGNLVLCQDAAYHQLLHVRTRALQATGNPALLKCRFCQEYDHPDSDDMYVYPNGTHGAHRSCRSAYRTDKRRAAA